MLTLDRPPLLPHLPHGSPHCRREPLWPQRTQKESVSRVQEIYQQEKGCGYYTTAHEEGDGNTAEEEFCEGNVIRRVENDSEDGYILRICWAQAQVIIEDEHPFKGFHQQAAKRNPFMNGGRTSRNLTQQQIWDMEAIIRPRFQPPVININHDPWRPQQQDMEVDMTSYGRTQPQAMNPNDNPFRGYQQQIRNNNAMYNIRSQPQATNQNQNPSRGTQLQAKNHESIVPSARRRASRHDAEDVWEI
jgi:hypothetical protein